MICEMNNMNKQLFYKTLMQFLYSFREMVRVILPFFKWQRRKYFIDEENKLIYIPVSKAGNTTIKTMLLRDRWNEAMLNNSVYAIHKSKELKKYTSKKLPQDYKNYFIFSVIREPRQRLRSVYKNKFLDLKKIRSNGFEYNRYLGGLFSGRESYEEFLDKIKLIPNRLKEDHFVEQWFWIYKVHKLNPRIYDINNTESLRADLKAFTGKNYEIDRRNESEMNFEPTTDEEKIEEQVISNIEKLFYESYRSD
jgi:hypothetical protein